MPWIIQSGGGTIIAVKVSPGASRNAIGGVHGDELRMRVASAPEGGKANRELVRYLADELGVRRSEVTLVSGKTSRRKKVLVQGLSPADVAERVKRRMRDEG